MNNEERAIKCIKLLDEHIKGNKTLTEKEILVVSGIVRKQSRVSFFFFAKHVLGFDLLTEQTHKRWADNLQERFFIKKKIMRLKPRGTFKTTLFGIALLLWVWGTISAEVKIFYTSSNLLLLQEVSDKINQYIDFNSETVYSVAFSIHRDPTAKNTDDIFNIIGRSGKGFSLTLRTAGGSTVGVHPNLIIVDDPMDKNDRESDSIRKKKARWFDTLKPLLIPFKSKYGIIENIMLIATRWHFNDLVSYILKKNENASDKEKWDIESESIYDKDRKSNYPEFITDEKIKSIKDDIDEIFFACQYENKALPEGMQLFSKDRLHFVKSHQVDIVSSQIKCFFDPSRGKESSDYPAVIWTCFDGNKLTVIDAVDKKIEIAKLIYIIAETNKRYNTSEMVYEDNGTMLVGDSLERVHREINYPIIITPLTSKGNKHVRISSMQPDLYSGYCRFLTDYKKRYPEMMNHIEYYPVWGYDDYADVLRMAIVNHKTPKFEPEGYDGIS